jgi:hypothetical protein
MRRLLNTLCSLKRKKWTAAELDMVEGDVIMVLCEVEAYLPLTEMDLKLHILIHIPDKIRKTGPLWVTAMWVYEGMWKQLLRFSRNQAAPELSILRGYADYELAMHAFWEDPEKFAVKAIRDFQDDFVEETSLRYQIPRELTPTATIQYDGALQHRSPDNKTLFALHNFYVNYHER